MDEEIDGVEVEIGRKLYVLPPLSFKLLRRYKKEIMDIQRIELGKFEPGEQDEGALFLLRYTPLILDALKRNYPEMTLDDLEDGLDLGDMNGGRSGRIGEMFKALFGVSGIDGDGDAKPGESPAVTS
ncbi:MAG: hypothetical protein ACRDQZ_18945 [Mycobacteriales bacterium]